MGAEPAFSQLSVAIYAVPIPNLLTARIMERKKGDDTWVWNPDGQDEFGIFRMKKGVFGAGNILAILLSS